MQIPHTSDIKENWIIGSEYLWSIILDNFEEHAHLNSAKKASRDGWKLLLSGHLASVTFNLTTSSLRYLFGKGIVTLQACGNKTFCSSWICIHNDGLILTGECGCAAALISLCKHVFDIIHYIESEVTLDHNETCTSKKQKWDVHFCRKSEKGKSPIKVANFLFAKSHPE